MTTAEITRTDDEIQRDVLKELQWDARVRSNEIGVAVKDGIVTLSGWVDSYFKKWAAEEAAHRVRGVKAVVNDVEVRLPGEGERSDIDIAEAVARSLDLDVLVPSDRIKVTVSQGVVRLEGEVDWEFQRREAENVVRPLAGVRAVINLITVRRREKLSPEELKRRIEDALIRSAAIDAEHITVEVQGDKVILRGTVRSWAERQEAERVAWSAPGVTAVENHITVRLT